MNSEWKHVRDSEPPLGYGNTILVLTKYHPITQFIELLAGHAFKWKDKYYIAVEAEYHYEFEYWMDAPKELPDEYKGLK